MEVGRSWRSWYLYWEWRVRKRELEDKSCSFREAKVSRQGIKTWRAWAKGRAARREGLATVEGEVWAVAAKRRALRALGTVKETRKLERWAKERGEAEGLKRNLKKWRWWVYAAVTKKEMEETIDETRRGFALKRR